MSGGTSTGTAGTQPRLTSEDVQSYIARLEYHERVLIAILAKQGPTRVDYQLLGEASRGCYYEIEDFPNGTDTLGIQVNTIKEPPRD